MNNLQKNEETVSIRLITTDRKATQIGLDFEKNITNKNVLCVDSNMVAQEHLSTMDLELIRQENNIYYVYAGGVLDSTWTKPSDAIIRADQKMGVVLNRQQQYVWERGNRDDSHQINLEEVPSAVLEGWAGRKCSAAGAGRRLYSAESYRMQSGQCTVSGRKGKSCDR